MNESKPATSNSIPTPDLGGKGPSKGSRRAGRSKAVTAAVIGAVAVVAAALIAAIVAVVTPGATLYWNRTGDIHIADVQFALSGGKPAIEVVVSNHTNVLQSAVSLSLQLAQGSLLPQISATLFGGSTYELADKLVIESSGALTGRLQAEDHVLYPFNGSLLISGTRDWHLAVTIPIREKFRAQETRSVFLVVPTTISVVSKVRGNGTYFSHDGTSKFRVLDFLKGRGPVTVFVFVTREDGKVGIYRGFVTL